MLNHGIPYVSLSQSLSRLCRRTAFHFVEHSSTTRLHSTFDKYIIYIIYSLDKVADVVWGQLPWFGYSILPQAFAGPMFLGFGCDVCELHHGSKYCSEPLVRNEMSRYFVAVHRSRTKGFIMQNHVFYTEATLFQRNPCHHSCDTFSKLSRSALSLLFNLPRLSQINLISMPSMEFVTWLMCFYVELPKHSHWQQCFQRWPSESLAAQHGR